MSLEFIIIIIVTGGWDSSVGIAIFYEVSSPMFRPPVEGEIFVTHAQISRESSSFLHNGCRSLCRGLEITMCHRRRV